MTRGSRARTCSVLSGPTRWPGSGAMTRPRHPCGGSSTGQRPAVASPRCWPPPGWPPRLPSAAVTTPRPRGSASGAAAAERALRAAYQGFAAIGATAYVRLTEADAAQWDMRLDEVLAVLTARERQVCVLAGRGLTSTRIARELSIDVKTVESHRTSAYRKLGVRSLAELKRLLGA